MVCRVLSYYLADCTEVISKSQRGARGSDRLRYASTQLRSAQVLKQNSLITRERQ